MTPATNYNSFLLQRCPTSIDGCQVPECVKGKCIYADAPNGVPCDDGLLFRL